MGDSCCLGNATAIPAVPTTSICSSGGSFQHGICLPSSCRSRTWQLVTCQENCQPCGSAPSGCEPASCQPTCLPHKRGLLATFSESSPTFPPGAGEEIYPEVLSHRG
uniref:Uncharacterized protein n=1 Tax=Capra hircus TaxID=9925 RepID=A0A8C2PH79_CAPHI